MCENYVNLFYKMLHLVNTPYELHSELNPIYSCKSIQNRFENFFFLFSIIPDHKKFKPLASSVASNFFCSQFSFQFHQRDTFRNEV